MVQENYSLRPAIRPLAAYNYVGWPVQSDLVGTRRSAPVKSRSRVQPAFGELNTLTHLHAKSTTSHHEQDLYCLSKVAIRRANRIADRVHPCHILIVLTYVLVRHESGPIWI